MWFIFYGLSQCAEYFGCVWISIPFVGFVENWRTQTHSDRDKEGERQIEIVIERGRSDCSTICVSVWKISLFLHFTPNWNPPTEPLYELTKERQFADSIFRLILKYKKKKIFIRMIDTLVHLWV